MNRNQELINYMIASNVLYSPLLIEAFHKCDRMFFVPERMLGEVYSDYPLQIGKGQTISQPTTVAIMLELLNPLPGQKILDIGSGSGWTTALLATMVGKDGFIEGMERIPSLVEYGRRSLEKMHIKNASISLASPDILGNLGHYYDRILVSASAQKLPTTLLDQLKPKGVMVIPIGNSIWRISKQEDGAIDASEFSGFIFVPLIVP